MHPSHWSLFAAATMVAGVARGADSTTTAPWWNDRWEMRIPIEIESRAQMPATDVPVVLPVGLLAMPRDINIESLSLVSSNGVTRPFQIDDLDEDGRFEALDEFCFYVDAHAATQTVYLYLSRRPDAIAPPARAPSVELIGSEFSNGSIKSTKDCFAVDVPGCGWRKLCRVPIGFTFDLFEYGQGFPTSWTTSIAASGPVRTVIRRRGGPVKIRGVTAEVSQDTVVYTRRREVCFRSRLVNLTQKGPNIVIRRARFVLQDVFPSASWDIPIVRGRGGSRGGHAVSLPDGSRDTPSRSAMGWVDLVAIDALGTPVYSIGLLLPSRPSVWCDLQRGKQTHLYCNVARTDRCSVPAGSDLRMDVWLIPHEGRTDQLEAFRKQRDAIRVFPLPIQKRDAR